MINSDLSASLRLFLIKAISLRDLYYTLAAHTSGSHVKVYNVPNYGNVYSSSMAEYLSRK